MVPVGQGVDAPVHVHVDVVRGQLDGLAVLVQHAALARQDQIALVVQIEAPRPGIGHLPVPLDGEEAVPFNGEVQGQLRLLQGALGVVGIQLVGGQDVGVGPDLLGVHLVLVAHPAEHDLPEGGGVGIPVGLIAGGGDVGHIVGDHVQPAALTEHTGRQLIKASEHYVFAPLTPGAEFPRSCTAAYITLISGSRGNGSGISGAR